MKTATDLLDKLNDLRSKYAERDERYLANWYAYKGEYERIYEDYTSDPLTLSRGRTERTIQKWNLVRPIVDTHKVLINQLPIIRVPAPVLGESLAALKADKMEKALYALWDTMRMKKKHGEASFNLALNWATVWQASWDEEKDIPDVFVRAPGETYPVMKRGGDEVAYCFFRWEEDAESIAEKWPQVKPLLTRNRLGQYSFTTIEIVEYVDATQRLMIIGGDVKSLLPEGGKHDLGICPVVITSAAYVPGELFPPGPIDQLVAMNDHLNRFQTKLGDAIEETLFGWHDVTGPGAKDVVLNTGPGATNYFEDEIKHEYTQPQAPPAQAFGHVDQVQRYMRNLANWPEVASGEMSSSIVTGKAVSRLQGIMAAQAAETQSNLGDDLARVNSIVLQMMEQYRPNKRFDLYATESVTVSSAPGRKRNFGISVIPGEDFQGYYLNELVYSMFGSDINASMQVGMQLVAERIFPRSWLRNLIPGGSDAEGMEAEIREEDRERAQFEADLQVQVQERILQAQVQQQQQLAALQQGMGGTGAEAPAGTTENAPQPTGGLPPSPNAVPGGEMVAGNAMLMPGGQPQMMGVGEPLTGTEGFPIPYTPLKPYGPALEQVTGGGQQGGGRLATEAMPGRNVVRADDIIAALEKAVNRKGEQAMGKLRGKVYLMGQIAERGWTDGKIEIGITVRSDQQVITTALPEYALQKRLQFRMVSASAEPEGAILISAGATAPQTAEVR